MATDICEMAPLEQTRKLIKMLDTWRAILNAAEDMLRIDEDIAADGGDPFSPWPKETSELVEQLSETVLADRKSKLDELFKDHDESCRMDVTTCDTFVPKKLRAKIVRRTKVTTEIKEGVLAASRRDPRPTGKAIAEEFMVSSATVSRILNNREINHTLKGQQEFAVMKAEKI